MKLSDFDNVYELVRERSGITSWLQAVDDPDGGHTIRLETCNRYAEAPEAMYDDLLGHMIDKCRARAAEVDTALAALGVTVDVPIDMPDDDDESGDDRQTLAAVMVEHRGAA